MSVLTRPSVVIFVCSSTGEGDPPDNSTRFFGKLKRFIRDQKKHQMNSSLPRVALPFLVWEIPIIPVFKALPDLFTK